MPEASQQDEQIELILPIGPPGCFLEVSKVAQTIGLLFPRNKVCISFGIKQWVGPHFGRNFHQHFRSPCFQGTWKVILKYYVQAALQIEWFHRAIFFFVVSNVRTAPEEFSVLLTEAELQVVEWQNLKKFLKMGNRCGSAVK
jgi:hypothetical protein